MALRILHVLRSLDPRSGGPVEGVRQLTRRNLRIGHSIELLTLDAPDAPWLRQMEVPVHAVGPSWKVYGYTPRLVPWLRAHADGYDCVVVNGMWDYNAYGTWRALRKMSVPYFVFTHGMLDPWFKRRYPLKHLKKWAYWPWGGYPVLRDAHAVFFTCEEERRLARESFWLYDCHEFVLRYGTDGVPWPVSGDNEAAFFAAHPTLRGKRLFTFLGRVHPKKGPDLFLKAVRSLIDRGSWDPKTMRAVMAGPVDGAYAAKLREMVTQLRLEDVVYWTGMLQGAQKWGALRSAEAFVLASHQENFGIAVVEALSVGTPVLLGKGVNIWPEIVGDGAGLADAPSVEGCARMLERWLEMTPDAQAEMRRRTRPCFERRFTAEAAANTFTAALYLLIGVHGGSHLPNPTSR